MIDDGVLNSISKVNQHVFTAFVPQDHRYMQQPVIHTYERTCENTYMLPGKYKRNAMFDAVCAEVSPQVSKHIDNCMGIEARNIAEGLCLVLEGVSLRTDHVNFVTSLLTTEMVRNVSKSHVSLRNKFCEVLVESEVPKDENICKLMQCLLNKCTVFVWNDIKQYSVFGENVGTIVVISSSPFKVSVYENFEKSLNDLQNNGFLEYKQYKKMKLCDLRAYAVSIGINELDIRKFKKEELSNTIEGVLKR